MWRKRRPMPEPKQLDPPPDYTDVYRDAARQIRNHGWCHHGGIDRNGRICLLIAITTAARDHLADDDTAAINGPALHAARTLAPQGRAGSAYSLIAYNEAPERTEHDILTFLDGLSA